MWRHVASCICLCALPSQSDFEAGGEGARDRTFSLFFANAEIGANPPKTLPLRSERPSRPEDNHGRAGAPSRQSAERGRCRPSASSLKNFRDIEGAEGGRRGESASNSPLWSLKQPPLRGSSHNRTSDAMGRITTHCGHTRMHAQKHKQAQDVCACAHTTRSRSARPNCCALQSK